MKDKHRKKNLTGPALTILIVNVFLLRITPVSAEEPAAKQIMEQATENRRLAGSESIVTLNIANSRGQKRVRKMATATKLVDGGATEKKLVRILSPADVKGTGFLTFDHENDDDDLWMYIPALRKTRRILSSDRSKSFMGSEFSYADMNLPNIDNYRYRILREEKAGGTDCWVIESVAKTEKIADEDGYSKKIVHIGKRDHTLRKAVYFDLRGALLKELVARKIELVDPTHKRHRAMYLEMINKQNGRRSVMVTEKFEYVDSVDDDYFTTRYLERT